MKIMFFLLSVLLFLSGCSKPTNNQPPMAPPPSPQLKYKVYADSDEIKVMSFNVNTANSDSTNPNSWENRRSACVSLIKEHKPTIIGFQEAQYTSQWLYLKEQLQDNYEGFGVNRVNGKESGSGETMGILYDKELIEKIDGGTFWLSETPDTPSKGWDASYYRTATWGIFKHLPTERIFYYINTHLDNGSQKAQIEGMKLIAEHLSQYNNDNYDLFLTGDLNVDSGNDAIDPIRDFMWNTRLYAPLSDDDDTYNGYSSKPSRKIIDHIYSKRGLQVVEYKTINEKYGDRDFVSDHYPIYAIVKLK